MWFAAVCTCTVSRRKLLMLWQPQHQQVAVPVYQVQGTRYMFLWQLLTVLMVCVCACVRIHARAFLITTDELDGSSPQPLWLSNTRAVRTAVRCGITAAAAAVQHQ